MATNDRFRVPIDTDYVHSLGLAIICFARLEWNVAWCCEKLQPGFIKKVSDLTAGQIAKQFSALLSECHMKQRKNLEIDHAVEFKKIVTLRNDLIHSNPSTAPDGAQLMVRKGEFWTPSKIDEFADACVELSSPFNRFVHTPLTPRLPIHN